MINYSEIQKKNEREKILDERTRTSKDPNATRRKLRTILFTRNEALTDDFLLYFFFLFFFSLWEMLCSYSMNFLNYEEFEYEEWKRERETQRKKEGESESERRILFSADIRCVRFSSFERFYVLFCCANNVTKTVWKIKRILLVNAAAAAVIVSVRIESEYLDLVFVTAATILAAYARVLPNFTTHSAVAAYVFEYFQNCFYYIFFSLHFPFRFTSITLHSIVFFLLLFSIRFSFF